MASYLRGKGGRFVLDGLRLKVSEWSGRIDRAETDSSCYEDSGYSFRVLENRTCEVQFVAVWDDDEDLLGNLWFGLANLTEDDFDEGWELSDVKLYPDYGQRNDLYIHMEDAILTGCEITCNVAEKVTLKGTIKNQGFFEWKGT